MFHKDYEYMLFEPFATITHLHYMDSDIYTNYNFLSYCCQFESHFIIDLVSKLYSRTKSICLQWVGCD